MAGLLRLIFFSLFLLGQESVEENSLCQATPTASNYTVNIVVVLPNDASYLASIPRVRPAVTLAVDKVTKLQLLPGWTINPTFLDSRCDTSHCTNMVIQSYQKGTVHLFLGPVCDYVVAPLARLLKYWNLPMLTAGALAREYGKDKSHPESEFYLLTRIGLSFNGLSSVAIASFKHFGWRKIMFIYDSDGRKEVEKEEYCILGIRAIIEDLRKSENFTYGTERLHGNFTKEKYKYLLEKKVGSTYGGSF